MRAAGYEHGPRLWHGLDFEHTSEVSRVREAVVLGRATGRGWGREARSHSRVGYTEVTQHIASLPACAAPMLPSAHSARPSQARCENAAP